jgi:hypothetical protein
VTEVVPANLWAVGCCADAGAAAATHQASPATKIPARIVILLG